MRLHHFDLSHSTVSHLQLDARARWSLDPATTGGPRSGHLITPVQDLGQSSQGIRLNWVAQWTAPLHWKKCASNPVYGPHLSGGWDHWTNGVSIVPTADGKTYRMYYAGRRGEGIGFAEAAVTDPLTWREHPASPVLKPRADNWEGDQINQPRVVAVTPDHWRMYYSGWGFQGPGTTWAMGLAESFDGGTTWQRYGDEPVLERGDAASPDGGGACVPMVVRVEDRWMMWYTACRVNPDGHQNIHLCLATSEDGLQWEKYHGNPVLSDDFSDGAARSVTSRCYVRYDNGVFRMWYSFAKPDYRIHYAESLDGMRWERAPLAPVLGPAPAPAWDDVMVEYPEVRIVDGRFRLWFCGNGYGSVGYAEGVPVTGVRLMVRTGGSPQPDESWTDWHEVQRDQKFEAGQFLQVRAELWSEDSTLSPTLNQVSIHHA